MKNTLGLILLVLVTLGLVFLAPFLLLWSVNTLFPALGIPLTFWTWLASFFIFGMFGSNRAKVN